MDILQTDDIKKILQDEKIKITINNKDYMLYITNSTYEKMKDVLPNHEVTKHESSKINFKVETNEELDNIIILLRDILAGEFEKILRFTIPLLFMD